MTATDISEPLDHLAQATAGALAVLPVDQIHPHPKNIRHNAAADDELVESIRAQGLLQPLVVAPIPGTELGNDDPGPAYRLIAGHRRLDGIKKAGGDHATVIIRRDLTDEADQVAAMLVENGRRADLTPLEEAEGYGQLRFDFGWKPGAIAKAAGHTVDTVNKRLKLLKLDTKVQKTLDEGQLSIEDAIAISDLPQAEQTKVSRTAGTGSFKWELSKAKERVKKQAATDKLLAQLDAAGVPKRNLPAAGYWGLNHADHGMTRLSETFSGDRDDHPDCLAYVVKKDDWTGVTSVEYVCTNVPAHDEQLDEQRRRERQKAEKAEREAAERETAERIARELRLDAVVGSLKPGAKVDPALVAIIRAVTPFLVAGLDDKALLYYSDLLDIPTEDRWGDREYSRKKADVEKFDRHMTAIVTGKPYQLLRAFIAAIAAKQEAWVIGRVGWRAKSSHPWERLVLDDALAWLTLVEGTGHTLTPVDLEIRDLATGAKIKES